MSEKNSDWYKKLSETLSDEEIAESYVLPSELTKEEEKQAAEDLWEFRKKRLAGMSEEAKIFSGLLRIKYQIEDYVNSQGYEEGRELSKYLKEYLQVTNKKQKELAADIGIHPTRLSRILNGRERIGKSIAYRLEKHSGNLIPAILWWKLVQKEIENEINTDEEERAKEEMNVKNVVYQKAS